jgi:hypothetical protein
MMTDESGRRYPIRTRRHEASGNERTHRKSDDVRTPDLQMVQEPQDIVGHFQAVGGRFRGLIALSVSTAIERNHAVVCGETREYSRLDPVSVSVGDVSVDQHYRRTLTCFDVANPNASGVEEAIGLPRK